MLSCSASRLWTETRSPGAACAFLARELPTVSAFCVASACLVQPDVTYDDVGGAGESLEKLREVVELPLLHPERFVTLGIDPPKVHGCTLVQLLHFRRASVCAPELGVGGWSRSGRCCWFQMVYAAPAARLSCVPALF